MEASKSGHASTLAHCVLHCMSKDTLLLCKVQYMCCTLYEGVLFVCSTTTSKDVPLLVAKGLINSVMWKAWQGGTGNAESVVGRERGEGNVLGHFLVNRKGTDGCSLISSNASCRLWRRQCMRRVLEDAARSRACTGKRAEQLPAVLLCLSG